MVAIKKQLVPSRSKTYSGLNGRKYITIHETANTKKGANAQAHANLQSKGFSSSWHWTVDDKEAIQSFPHTVRCWHAGDGRGRGNMDSIGIEICVNSDGDFKKAVENAAELTKKIMADENIPITNVVQHNKWSGKNCPAFLRSGKKGITWDDFLAMVKGEKVVDTKQKIKPATTTKPTVTKQSNARTIVKTIQSTLNSRYGLNIAVDGIYGPQTKAALVKALQTELNRQFGARLVVDGIFGKKTRAACVNVRYGAKGNITWIIQAALYCLGYDPKGLDGIFGKNTANAVLVFQKANGLAQDAIVGKNTFAEMFA